MDIEMREQLETLATIGEDINSRLTEVLDRTNDESSEWMFKQDLKWVDESLQDAQRHLGQLKWLAGRDQPSRKVRAMNAILEYVNLTRSASREMDTKLQELTLLIDTNDEENVESTDMDEIWQTLFRAEEYRDELSNALDTVRHFVSRLDDIMYGNPLNEPNDNKKEE